MNHLRSQIATMALLALAFCFQVSPAAVTRDVSQRASGEFLEATGRHGAIASGRKVAADAGLEILKSGGNAFDAAAGTLLVQTVVKSKSCCIGGEVSILVYDAKRQTVEVVCGLGTAPKLATLDYFQKYKNGKIGGNGDPSAAAVPATLHACLTLLDRYGTKTFEEVAQPMVRALDRDEPAWSGDLARTIAGMIDAERRRTADRHSGIQAAIDYFYRGPVAREIDHWSRENGGLIRYKDLASHKTRVEQPVSIEYRNHTVYKCGPWTQGPFLLQSLRLLDGFNLKAMGRNGPDYIHLVTEAMKLAFADRDAYYADPMFHDVPLRQLLSVQYSDIRRSLIDMKHASLEQRPGDPRSMTALLDRAPPAGNPLDKAVPDTTTCLVADRWGNVVAATPSGAASRVAGKTGVLLGGRLVSLNTWESHPNCIEPGKRPRITLTPTLVLKEGRPVFAVSVAGGDLQDQATLQILLNLIEFGQTPAEAVTAARFSTSHHVGSFSQPPPELGSLFVHESIPAETIGELKSRGHIVSVVNRAIGAAVALSIEPQTQTIHVAGDPRTGRHFAAY